MLANGKVWVIISCENLSDSIKEAIDSGQFALAQSLSYKANALADKLGKFVQGSGGHLYVNLIERQVLEIPPSLAEQIPNILEGYRQDLQGKISVGIGLTFSEAASAMRLSQISDEIELYDPDDDRFGGVRDYVSKAEVELPENVFDVSMPPIEPHDGRLEFDQNPKFVLRPDADKELQSESKMIQAMSQIMSGPAPQGQQQPQQQQQQPRDLREALEGGQVRGYTPASQGQAKSKEQQSQASQRAAEKPSKSDDSAASESEKEPDKLGSLLHSVKASLPQIMQLHDSNPEAFKHAMDMIKKLLVLAKDKKIKKAEEFTENLNKALRLRLPVGSRKGNKKKVLIGGREKWRSMGAGQTEDSSGQAVSVKSHNKDSIHQEHE